MGSRFSLSSEAWATPLGTVEIDTALLCDIKAGSGLLEEDPAAHAGEHSVEVQLPFIQKASPGAKIVPLTVAHGHLAELSEIAHAIAAAVESSASRVMIVASSDMTHYESREQAGKKDKAAIQKVLDLDPEGLIDTVQRMQISMCGYMPAAIMLMAAKELGAGAAKLVKYTDSGEVTGDAAEVVGYAGIVVY